MESRFSSLFAVLYDADTGGLSVEDPKLEAVSKALGMKEVSVTFKAKQMTDFSTLVRRLLGCLNYQDLAIIAMIKLLQQLFASTSVPSESSRLDEDRMQGWKNRCYPASSSMRSLSPSRLTSTEICRTRHLLIYPRRLPVISGNQLNHAEAVKT